MVLPTNTQYRPDLRIYIGGIDITQYYVIDDGLQVEWTADYPSLSTFTTSSVTVILDNLDRYFDPRALSNFFTDNSMPNHGHNAHVAIELGFEGDVVFVFAGVIADIQTSLDNTKAEVLILDLSAQLRNNRVIDFGESQPTVDINRVVDANSEFQKFQPIFKFPEGRYPISMESVIAHLVYRDLSQEPDPINIVSSVRKEGILSPLNAEVDYEDGEITFESAPLESENQQILASWKYLYRFKRPDTLARLLLENSNIYDQLGYSNDTVARAGIPQARVRHDRAPQFSSHGRIGFLEGKGVVRWMGRTLLANSSHLDNVSTYWYFTADSDFLEYDEYQDEHRTVSTIPDQSEELRASASYTVNHTTVIANPSRDGKLKFTFTGGTGTGRISILGTLNLTQLSENIEVDLGSETEYTSFNEYDDQITFQVRGGISGGTLRIEAVLENEFVLMDCATLDYSTFYFLATNDLRGDSTSVLVGLDVRIYRYQIQTDTWTLIADKSDQWPQTAIPYDFTVGLNPIADNRKNFRLIEHNNQRFLYYIFADSTGYGGVKRYSESSDTHTVVYDDGSRDYKYGIDFEIDIPVYPVTTPPSNPQLYVFAAWDPNVYQVLGDFAVIRMGLNGSGQTQIYYERFASGTAKPITASDIFLDDDTDRWYFVLNFMDTNSQTRPGISQLSRLNKSGQSDGTRLVLKQYEESLYSARSPGYLRLNNQLRIFYLEGTWLSAIANTPLSSGYPTSDVSGHLIEVDTTSGLITDLGLVWRSRLSPAYTNPGAYNAAQQEDLQGYGMHTAFPSNMVGDDRDSLYFIAGYDMPVDITNYRIKTRDVAPVNFADNYLWLQWGFDLATKIETFNTNGQNTWGLLEQLATIMNWEVGFGIDQDLIQRLRSNFPSQSDTFGLNANLLFRPRRLTVGKLATDLSGTGTPTQIDIADPGFILNRISRFPVPPTGDRNYVVIGNEIFSYTGVTPINDLTGIQRGLLDSPITSHDQDDSVLLINMFATNTQTVKTLDSIESRSNDFPNLFTSVDVPYATYFYTLDSDNAIEEHGFLKYNVENSLLGEHDRPWAEMLGQSYLQELFEVRQLIEFTTVFSPGLKIGQMILLHQEERLNLEYLKVRALRIQHDITNWQTTILGREVGEPVVLAFAPHISPVTIRSFVQGQPIPTLVLRASGRPAPTWSVLTPLPLGLNFVSTTGNTVEIGGTPTTVQTLDTTIRARNSEGFDDEIIAFEITPAFSAPQITAPTITSYLYTTGTDVALDLTAMGNPQVTLWSITTGVLPSGLSFSSGSGNAIQIRGRVDTVYPEQTVTITATNGIDPPATIDITFEVTQGQSAAMFSGSVAAQSLPLDQVITTIPLPFTGNPAPVFGESPFSTVA